MNPFIKCGGSSTPKFLVSNNYKNQSFNDIIKANFELNTMTNSYIGDDELSLLRLKLLIQKNIMKEYQSWVNKMLLIIGEKNEEDNIHFDFGTPIQEGLQKIEDLYKENFKIKQKFIKEISKNENLSKKIEEMKKENNMINQEYHIETLEQINNEKNQLVNNIQILANEVDELGDKNREYEDYIQKNTELKNYSDLYKQYFKVEKENQDIKKIVEMQNRKNCLNYGNKKIFQNYLDNPKTMKNLGKFDLEKEENFVDLGFFGCGVTK